MKVYEAVFNEEMEGVYALSVVENPAMEDMFIALSEDEATHKIELATIDEDKRLLLGAALIPNKKVYRNVDGHEFFITFKEETIEQLAHNFAKQQNNNNSSLEHEISLNGMSVVENWIVEDSHKDKSANYGKNYPVGTWVTMMKVDNDEIWNKVKNGEIKGFSIDALLGLTEVKFNINKPKMTKQDFLKELKSIFTFSDEPKEEIEAQASEVKEDLTQPEVDAKGDEVILETIEVEEEALNLDAIKEVLSQFKAEVKKDIEDFKAEFSKVEKEVEEKEKEVEDLKVELEKQPEVEPIKVNPESKTQTQVKLSTPKTTKSRALENIAQSMGW